MSDSDGNYTITFKDNRKLKITVTPGNHGEICIEETGGKSRSVIAGKNAPKIIPTPAQMPDDGIRVRENASPDGYVDMRLRKK